MKLFANHVFILLAVGLVVGCGAGNEKEVYPVVGSVEVDGYVPVDASVIFHPTEISDDEKFPVPRGTVKSDGTFEIRTYGSSDGAPEGQYKVTFLWQGAKSDYEDLTEDQYDKLPNLIPQKYQTTGTTDINVTVTAGENILKKFVLVGE